jgi:hypothetical protein
MSRQAPGNGRLAFIAVFFIIFSMTPTKPLLSALFAGFLLFGASIAQCDESAPAQAAPSQSAPSQSASTTQNLHVLDFRVSGLAVYQGGGSSYSIGVSWVPEYRLSDTFYAGLNLGGTVIGDAANNNFGVAEYQAIFGDHFTEDWGGELGAGAQTWFGGRGTYGMFSGTVYRHLAQPAAMIDRIFATYSLALVTGSAASEIKLGAGISF